MLLKRGDMFILYSAAYKGVYKIVDYRTEPRFFVDLVSEGSLSTPLTTTTLYSAKLKKVIPEIPTGKSNVDLHLARNLVRIIDPMKVSVKITGNPMFKYSSLTELWLRKGQGFKIWTIGATSDLRETLAPTLEFYPENQYNARVEIITRKYGVKLIEPLSIKDIYEAKEVAKERGLPLVVTDDPQSFTFDDYFTQPFTAFHDVSSASTDEQVVAVPSMPSGHTGFIFARATDIIITNTDGSNAATVSLKEYVGGSYSTKMTVIISAASTFKLEDVAIDFQNRIGINSDNANVVISVSGYYW